MSMVREEYVRMDELEGSMWWYAGLHANVRFALNCRIPAFSDLLDAGCGTGGVLQIIEKDHPRTHLHGLDISSVAVDLARTKCTANVVTGSVDELPYADHKFDVLLSLDVLGYDIDRSATLSGFYRVLRPGGRLVLSLPAYQWMLSYHDRSVGQAKRFTTTEVKDMLVEHGFRIRHITYWNTILFPLMMIRRKLLPDPGHSDVTPFSPVVDRLFRTCLRMERFFTERNIGLPFGGSMFIVAERPA